MAYQVSVTSRAARDFAAIYEGIDAGQSNAALKWHRGLKEAVLSLEEQPLRCPVTRVKGQIRQLLCGKKPHVYRVIYRVVENQKQVQVLHIRHGATRRFKASDLDEHKL